MDGKKDITVFNQKLAGYLMTLGFRLQGMKQDKRFPDRNVFFFSNIPEVKKAIANYALRK